MGTRARPTLRVSAVAARLGVSPSTLRSWDRRYGLGPSSHVAGAHREYTSADLMRLLVMRRLTVQGVAPAAAARVALEPPPEPPEPGPRPNGPTASTTEETQTVLALHARSTDLVAAALAFDTPTCSAITAQAIAEHGAVATWTRLIEPALEQERMRAAAHAEQMLAIAVCAELVRATAIVPGEPRVLLACAPGEQQELPLYGLQAALAERCIPVRVLGSRMAWDVLAAVVHATAPSTVVVHASRPVEAAGGLHRVAVGHPSTTVMAAGNGWAGTYGAATGPDWLAAVLDRIQARR